MATTTRTVAQLISDISAIKTTPSGEVEYNNNSLQNILVNDLIPMTRERGIIYVRTPDLILNLGVANSNAVCITGSNSLYIYDTTILNASHYYAANDGGYWNRVEATATLALSDLSNVAAGTPTNSQVLMYSSGAGKWIYSTLGTTFASLTDVALSGLATYQTLYRNGSGKWANTSILAVNTATNTVTVTGSLAVTVNATVNGNLTVVGGVDAESLVLNSTLVVGTNASIYGTLTVAGNLSINSGNFSVTASNGNTSIAGELAVAGATTLSSTLAVTGVSTLTGLLNANGGIKVGTTKFIVDTAGNVSVDGNLSVASDATFNGEITTNGLMNLNGGITSAHFSVDNTNGDISTGGSLVVSGTGTFGDTISIASGKNISFNGNTFRITSAIAGTTLAAVGTDKYFSVSFNGTTYKMKLYS